MRDLAAIWLYVADSSCRGYSPLYDRICRAVSESDEVLDLVSRRPLAGTTRCCSSPRCTTCCSAASTTCWGRSTPGSPTLTRAAVRRPLSPQSGRAPGVARHRAGEHQRGGPVCGDRAGAHRGGVAAGAPLGHVDVGCSAGLNLLCDRYRLDYGPAGATGPDGAPVEIRCDVVGGSPPIAPALPTISARIGLDRAPLDVHDPDQSRWQLACVWPDTGRLTRTRLALDEARRTPLELVRGDAVEDVGELIASLPRDATAVVTTTWVVAYFSPEQRTGFREALSAASELVPWRGSARRATEWST